MVAVKIRLYLMLNILAQLRTMIPNVINYIDNGRLTAIQDVRTWTVSSPKCHKHWGLAHCPNTLSQLFFQFLAWLYRFM